MLCLLLAGPAAAAPASLAEIDNLYFHRHEGQNLGSSIKELRGLLKAQPQDSQALWRLGRSLVAAASAKAAKEEKISAFKEAEVPLKEAVKASPGSAKAHYWLARQMGGLNAQLRTLSLARSMKKELEAALALDPGDGAAHQTYGELLHQLPGLFGGDKKKAVRELEEAVRLTPDDTAHYQALAEAFLDLDEKAKAVAALQKVFEVKTPEDPAAWKSDLEDARDLLQKLTKAP